jgi:pimeloyl-ACP methyl ester carboxylesterase
MIRKHISSLNSRWSAYRAAHPIRSFLQIQAGILLLCVGIYGLAAVQVHAYENMVVRQSLLLSGPIPTPVLRFTPKRNALNTIAILAHGFSADKELMSSFAVDLARQGITAYAFDFPGHGASTVPYDGQQLVPSLSEVVDYALRHAKQPQPNLVLIGYSLGTIAVNEYAMTHPHLANLKATVIVSGVSPDLPTPSVPQNLLVLSGQLDLPGINPLAQKIIASGCGVPVSTVTDFFACAPTTLGVTAYRKRVVLPRLDHISIVTSGQAHRTTIAWLHDHVDARIGSQPIAPDARNQWLAAGILAGFLGGLPFLALASALMFRSVHVKRKRLTELDHLASWSVYWQGSLAFVGALVFALLILHLWLPKAFVAPDPWPFGFLAQMVSADVVLYFLLAGIALWGAILAIPALRSLVIVPSRWEIVRQIALGVALVLFLYLTIGALSSFAWESLALVPQRLWRAIVYALLAWPFYLGLQALLQPSAHRPHGRGVLADAAGAILILGALVFAIIMNFSRLSYLGILFPVVGIVYLLLLPFTAWTRRFIPSPAVLNATVMALVLGWMFAATLPLL